MINKITFILALFLALVSCSGTKPYEVKSPCVSHDISNPWYKNPCIKRSVNWDIS